LFPKTQFPFQQNYLHSNGLIRVVGFRLRLASMFDGNFILSFLRSKALILMPQYIYLLPLIVKVKIHTFLEFSA